MKLRKINDIFLKNTWLMLLVYVLVFCVTGAQAKERHYTLTINDATVNISGKPAKAMLINDSLPGPVLEFEQGDIAVIRVKNELQSDASIHWHGLLLPQDQDGVPYLTALPIPAGGEFTYRFPITHAGTYWYHSHTNIDEQRGQYGSIVIHPSRPVVHHYQHDVVVQLSDWTDEDPVQVLKNLKKDGDWYSYKKDSVVSVAGYIQRKALTTWLKNRWQGMAGMDVSDVGYDAFLANGQQQLSLLKEAKEGDRVRLRLINAGASSYFAIETGEPELTVIAADGIDVQPVAVKSLTMAMAETYDVIVTVPASGALQINANNIDGTGGASIIVGDGDYKAAPQPQKPNLYQAMNHSGHSMKGNSGGHHHHGHAAQAASKKLNYGLLKTVEPVRHEGAVREVTLDLTGDMENYNWSFNNVPLSKADKILINRGEVVRFVFNNTTMMRHPLHLHGHFFKVLSGNGDFDVLKHTVDVAPMSKVVIEFKANAEKDWLFHCHNLYHVKTGMGRVVRYSDYSGNPVFAKAKSKSTDIKDTDWYYRADMGLYSQLLSLDFSARNQQLQVGLEIERGNWEDTELQAGLGYTINRKSSVFGRYDYERDEHIEWQFGVAYRLPFQVDGELWLNDEADVDIGLATEFQLSRFWQLEVGADSDQAWEAGFAYRRSPEWAIGLKIQDNARLSLGAELTF